MNVSFPQATSAKVEIQPPGRSASKGSIQPPANTALQEAAGTEVSLSDTGVPALKAQLATVPAIRQERVLSLQKAVENGTYKPGSQQIAEAIHADLFGAPSNTES